MRLLRTLSRISLLFVAMVLLANCSSEVPISVEAAIGVPGKYSVWLEPSLNRVGQSDAAGTRATIQLTAARGEYESFQVVVHALGSQLTNVKLATSALNGPNRAVIAASNIQLYREHYVNVAETSPNTGGSNPPLGAGLYADALIPAADPGTGAAPGAASLKAFPFDVAANTNQPMWVDVYVPYGTAPGDYTATFTVTSDQGNAEGTFQVRVWEFDLPPRPYLQSSFGVWVDELGQETAQELLRNKIMPRDVPEGELQAVGSADRTSADLGFWSGANVSSCSMSQPPSVDEIRKAAAALGPNLYIYNYSADEIDECTQLYGTLRQWAQNLHRAGIPNLVTMSPTPALYDDGLGSGRSVVDIWTMLPVMYDEASAQVAQVRQKGDSLWSYNSLVQDNYSPKWQIDFAPMNFRIQPGFISQSLGLKGLLYWRVDLWTNDPWNNVRTFNNGQRWFYGDGMLVYPGRQVGVSSSVASMRLKWMRDGVEDYDYVQMAKLRGQRAQALALSQQAGADWRTWTRDPQVIEQTRQQLAALILRGERVKVYVPLSRRK